MILIADSGSTKTDWCLMARNGHRRECQTEGINPFQQDKEAIYNTVSNVLLPQLARDLWAGPITNVYFYGAGCTPEKREVVRGAIQPCFRHAEIEVESDMLGAARALFGRERGIACILGTGSNSSLWDGEKFVQSVPALGYVLGDEGSGAVLGKRIAADMLKNQLGEEWKEKFLERFSTSQAEIIENVYRRPFPNRYLAQFAVFAKENIEQAEIRELVKEHFRQFVTRNLRQYHGTESVGFVGSIAYHFEEVLREVVESEGYRIDKIMRSPMEGLIEYHRYE